MDETKAEDIDGIREEMNDVTEMICDDIATLLEAINDVHLDMKTAKKELEMSVILLTKLNEKIQTQL